MKTYPFTRPTIIAAVELLGEVLTQATFSKLLVRLAFDNEITLGPEKSVTAKSALLASLIIKRSTEVIYTLNGPMTLAEAAVREAIDLLNPNNANVEQQRLLRGLALDGYIVSWSEHSVTPLLRASLPIEIDLPATDDEVHQLLKKFQFSTPLGHLDQAIDANTRGDWAASNSQIRTFMEALINDIAVKINANHTSNMSNENRRAWLTEINFLSSQRNEWTIDGKNFLNGLFKMLHTDGSHPGLSDEDHCTFRLHLALVTSRTLLRRIDNNR